VAFDGWSNSVLLGELAALYNAHRRGEPSPLPPLKAQYQDFARWQRQTLRGAVLVDQVRFWRDHLRGARPVDLTRGAPRAARPSHDAGLEMFLLPEQLEARIKAFASERRATLFMTLLAAFKVLLSAESGQEDIVVTSLLANRNQSEIENLIGNFFAGLPLRTRVAPERPFRELLEQVRETTLAAHEHPDVLYESVMEDLDFLRPGERGNLSTFRILFQFAKLPVAEEGLADLKVTRLPFDSGKIRQDLSLFFFQSGRISGRFKFNRDVLSRERVVALRDRYLRILRAAVEDPDRPVSDLLGE